MRWALVAVAVTGALGLAGCGKKKKEIAGIEGWHVNRTTLADASGRCMPEKLPDGRDGSYCFGQKPLGLRGMRAEVDLWFAGQEPSAKVVEIQLKVGGCDPEKLEGWLQTNLGAAAEVEGTRRAWTNSHMFVIGYLPLADEPGRCLVRMIPRREEARYQALWSAATSAAKPAAPAE